MRNEHCLFLCVICVYVRVYERVQMYTVDSAFNELGYNEISEFLNIHFFKTDFS